MVYIIYGEVKFFGVYVIEVVGEVGEFLIYFVDKFVIVVGIKLFCFDYVLFDGEFIVDSDEILDLEGLL